MRNDTASQLGEVEVAGENSSLGLSSSPREPVEPEPRASRLSTGGLELEKVWAAPLRARNCVSCLGVSYGSAIGGVPPEREGERASDREQALAGEVFGRPSDGAFPV